MPSTDCSRPLARRAALPVLALLSLAGAATVGAVPPAPPPVEVRSIDGSGNNLAHPAWGTPGAHLLRGPSGSHYGDGISSLAGASRPSPRAISNAVFHQDRSMPSAQGLSDFMWTWGQFVDHDLSLTEGSEESVPIPVPVGDPFFDPSGTGTVTIPFHRAVYDTTTGVTTPREQINHITAWIDGSNVYGSDPVRAAWLRTFSGGRLKLVPGPSGDMLPHNDGTMPNAGSPEVPDLSTTMFVSGDVRANEQPTLLCMHSLLTREHDWQADRIAAEDPSLSDEEIYQRARRIVVAEIQHVTYEEFVPALVGHGVLGSDRQYDPSVNPGIAAAFSTAGYRLGHTLLSSSVLRLDADWQPMPAGPMTLKDSFFDAAPPMVAAMGIEPMIRGVASQRMQELDHFVVSDVRNFLFGPPGAGGLDLVALNIQRGRDLGLPDFNTTRVDYGLPPLTSFDQITSDPALAETLRSLYGDVWDVDLFVGLLCEDDAPGAIVGPTLRAILVDQFARSEEADRFFYTRTLKGDELARVRATRLSDIIERNTSIRGIQRDVFHVRARGNE